MDTRYKTNLIEHVKSVGAWGQLSGLTTSIDPVSFTLTLQGPQKNVDLTPWFVGRRDGKRLSYFTTPDEFAIGFVGWLPYSVQSWEISRDKRAFKALLKQVGLQAPQTFASVREASSPFIVKRSRSAFGDGLQGPFLPDSAQAKAIRLKDGEYLEAFKTHRIARAWYWGPQLCVLEMFDMPTVRGDGQLTYLELLAHRLGAAAMALPPDFMHLGRLQNIEPKTIVPAGQSVLADYRYVSPFNPTVYQNSNVLTTSKPEIRARFADAGTKLWPHIPVASQFDAAFVLDAIVDENDQIWLLEINSNAQLHPDLYPAMLSSLSR